MTLAELAMETDASEATVKRTMFRLKRKGLVQHRPGEGGKPGSPGHWRCL